MKPIIFSTPMVQAIQEGRKTQTRRVIKPQPELCDHPHVFGPNDGQSQKPTTFMSDRFGNWFCSVCGKGLKQDPKSINEYDTVGIRCPYGQVGDTLYCREKAWYGPQEGRVEYDAAMDDDARDAARIYGAKLRPSIHMPKWAARIFLEITGVRVEFSEDITLEDAIAEGFGDEREFNETFLRLNPHLKDAKAWVWVISFKPIPQEVLC